jgi:5'-3' exonuclease
MGISVIRSPCGEAEKACAYLNSIGRCDGVITDDSDVFLYGAKCVYRNFNMDKKSEIKIEKYCMDKIERDLGYTREYLIVLGLILGCDYDQRGIPGVGQTNATKFLSEILSSNDKIVNILDFCRNWTKSGYKSSGLKYEDRIRKIILSEQLTFPNEEIVSEYMNISKLAQILLSNEKYLTIKWSRPNLKDCQLLNSSQTWSFEYTAEKLVPLIVQYEHEHVFELHERTIKPIRVNKVRRQAFVEYYEVIWTKLSRSNLDLDLSDLSEYVTLERFDVVQNCLPDLLKEYQEAVEAKKSTRKTKKNKKEPQKETEALTEAYDGMTSLYEEPTSPTLVAKPSKLLKPKTKKGKSHNRENQKKLDEEQVYDGMTSLYEEPAASPPKQIVAIKSQTTHVEKESFKSIFKAKQSTTEPKTSIIISDTESESDDCIILEDSFVSITTTTKTSIDEENNDQLDLLLQSFDNIKIDNKKKVQAKQKSPEIYVPFSQRMKTIYKNSTIFDK